MEICPRLEASLACVAREGSTKKYGKFVGYGWIGLYQDPGAAAAQLGWESWASGCNSNFRGWSDGEPSWRGGSPERCAFGVFHKRNISSVGYAEYGGGIFSAPCWSKKPCICEKGATTTDEYSSAADEFMAEESGWRAWRKDNRNAVIALLLCVFVVSCCCILGVIFHLSKAQSYVYVPQKMEDGSPTPGKQAAERELDIEAAKKELDAQFPDSAADEVAETNEAAGQSAVATTSTHVDLDPQPEPPTDPSTTDGVAVELVQVQITPATLGAAAENAEALVTEVADDRASCGFCCNGSSRVGLSDQQVRKMTSVAGAA
jgi:hypothetical protein